MSLGHLLLSVRDHLRTHLEESFSPEEIRVMPDDRPAPYMGQQFISITGYRWAPRGGDEDVNRGLFEEYDLLCALTFRSPSTPQDEVGEELYVKSLLGMEAVSRVIMLFIHLNYDIITTANTGIDNLGQDIIEPLRWKGTDAKPQPVGPDWFYAPDPGVDSFEYAQAGLVMRSYFGDALRAQNVGINGIYTEGGFPS